MYLPTPYVHYEYLQVQGSFYLGLSVPQAAS